MLPDVAAPLPLRAPRRDVDQDLLDDPRDTTLMTATTLDQIGEILSKIGTPSTFSASG